jgi:hypothetical protein
MDDDAVADAGVIFNDYGRFRAGMNYRYILNAAVAADLNF